MTTRPDFLPLLLLLLLSLSFLGLAASVCVPRNADPSKYLFSPAAPQSPNPNPSPPPSTTPADPSPPSAVPPPPDGPSASGSATLKSICAYTDYPDVCVSSIQSLAPSPGGALTVQEAAGLQIKALALKAQAALGYGRALMADPQAANGTGSCLKDCLDNYDDGVDNLDAARNALAARDLGTVNSMLSAAFDCFSCSDVFAEGEDLGHCKGPSPMKDHDDVLTKLTSNSLAICEHLDF